MSGTLRGLSVSVDIDSIHYYVALYGHMTTPDERRSLIARTWELGVQRFLDLFRELEIPATLFIVGKDLEVPTAAGIAARAVQAGHEPANHSLSHPYDLIHKFTNQIEHELQACQDRIAAATGRNPAGFRAPGYNTSKALLELLESKGYLYDASPLPSWPYLAAKYAVMAGLRLRGRKSASIIGNPTMGLGPTDPTREGGLVRFPCAVSRVTRLPIIGTTLVSLPSPMTAYLLHEAEARPFLSLEFHAADLMDVTSDHLPEVLKAQKDLNIPWKTKHEKISEALKRLKATHPAMTLEQAARQV